MFRKSHSVSPLLTACVLTALLSAGFVADAPVSPVTADKPVCLQTLSLPLPGIATAYAEGQKDFNNAAETMWDTATHFITGRDVFMRSGPSSDSEPQGFYRFGEPVRILEQAGDWYKVERVLSETPVYVHKDFVGDKGKVEAKSTASTPYMLRIDKLVDCLNAAAPFYTEGLDEAAKRKEIAYYKDTVTGMLYSIERSGLPQQTKNDMNHAVLDISDLFDCMTKYLDETDPAQKQARRDEAWPDLQYYFQEFYVTMDQYR